jgi:hypothetical protein
MCLRLGVPRAVQIRLLRQRREFGDPEGQKTKDKFVLCQNKTTNVCVEQLRLSTAWQALHSEWDQFTGGEASKGEALKNMHSELATTLDALKKAASANEEDDGTNEVATAQQVKEYAFIF